MRYWSDYARIYHHPRSLIQLPDLALGDRLLPFENWDLGTELFENLDREHDLLDRDLRPWVEECDQLQGFQVFAGADDAWGGFAARWVERMGDEYGRKSVWIWGMEGGARGARVGLIFVSLERSVCTVTLTGTSGEAVTKACQYCEVCLRAVHTGVCLRPGLEQADQRAGVSEPGRDVQVGYVWLAGRSDRKHDTAVAPQNEWRTTRDITGHGSSFQQRR